MLAIEALWDEVDAVNDWECILNALLLDHSAGHGRARFARRACTKRGESCMAVIGVGGNRAARGNHGIIASRQTGVHNRKKGSPHVIVFSDGIQVMFFSQGDEETVVSYPTRALIKGLLHTKIQCSSSTKQTKTVYLKCCSSPPPWMDLDHHLDMRMMNVRISVHVDECNDDVL